MKIDIAEDLVVRVYPRGREAPNGYPSEYCVTVTSRDLTMSRTSDWFSRGELTWRLPRFAAECALVFAGDREKCEARALAQQELRSFQAKWGIR